MKKLFRAGALALVLAGASFGASVDARAAAAPSDPGVVAPSEPEPAEKQWHYCDGSQLWDLNADGTRTPAGGCAGGTWVEYW